MKTQTFQIVADKPDVVVETQELLYGKPETYSYVMDDNSLETLSDIFNRKKHQTLFMFQLVDGDINKLWLLEMGIKKRCYAACPDTKEEVAKIMNGFKLEWKSEKIDKINAKLLIGSL